MTLPVIGKLFGVVTGALLVAALSVTAALATATVGKPAPAFTATDSLGQTVRLDAYRGKTVVLEWTNDGCPYVQKHYGAGNMQALQKKLTTEGIVWLTVISSAPGTQGFVSGLEADELTRTRGAAPTAVLLDPKGTVARLYDARTTPHMFIVTPDGTLAYKGAIDDKPTTRHEDIKTAVNYVTSALAQLAAGKPVDPAVTRSYGCSVKYAD